GLGGDDVGRAGGAFVSREAADIDDRPSAGLDQVRQRRLRAKESAVQNDGKHAVPVLEADFGERRLGADGCVVDEDIEPAEALYCGFDQPFDGVGVGYVRDVQLSASSRRPDELDRLFALGARGVRVHHDRGSAGCQRARDRAADVARAPGDQGNLAREVAAGRHPNAAGQPKPSSRLAYPKKKGAEGAPGWWFEKSGFGLALER